MLTCDCDATPEEAGAGGGLTLTLRLTDADGYTVPGSLRTITPDREADARAELAQLADEHAAEWADFGYHPAGYRILTDPTT